MKNYISTKRLLAFLTEHKDVFFNSDQELAMIKEKFRNREDYEQYTLVFGFGNKDENDEVTTIEYGQHLDTSDIFASLNQCLDYYKKNSIYGLYLTDESQIVIDICHRDEEDCVTMLGWNSVTEFKEKYQASCQSQLNFER